MASYQPISQIYLYDEPDAAGLDIEEIGGFVAAQFPSVEVQPRADFVTHQFRRFTPQQRAELEREMLKQFERAQVSDLEAIVGGGTVGAYQSEDLGLVFDATAYQTILRLLIEETEAGPDHVHLVFTENLIGSWREEKTLFQLQPICLGDPAILSTTGLVEAPAKPREYEYRRAQLAMFGMDTEALEDLAEDFASCTLGYGDPRLNEVCKGYALMACMHRMFGEAFCEDPNCRLFNARTQQEMMAAQCGPKAGLCERHQEMLQRVMGPKEDEE